MSTPTEVCFSINIPNNRA